MTWTKLGDEFFPEVADLSDAAAILHVKALGWSNWRLLDLVVPRKDLKRFAFIESKSVDDAVAELIEAGWWQQIDADTYWIGTRFPEWQRDKVQVEHLRQRKAADQRRKRRHELGDHSMCLPTSKCKSVSPGDGAGDSPDDGRGDPERNGYGPVEGNPKPSLDKKTSGTNAESARRWDLSPAELLEEKLAERAGSQ